MPLIRGAQLGDAVRSAVVLDLGDLKRQGDRILSTARAEADRIVAEARAERERLLEGASEEGRRAGTERGIEEGRARGAAEGREAAMAAHREKLAALEAAWTGALDEFRARREEMLLEARVDVLRLAVRVAEMVTRRRVELDDGAAAAQLEAVVSLVARPTRLVIRVHRDDVDAFREALPAAAARLGAGVRPGAAGGHVELAVDGTLAPRSCVASTPDGGMIDASLGTQLERIVAALLPGDAGGAGS